MTPAEPARPWGGIALVVVAASAFAVQDALIKQLGARFDLAQIVFLRSALLVAILVGLRASALGRGWRLVARRRPVLALLRSLANAAEWLFVYLGLRHLALGEATALFYVGPLFVTALAAPVLGEAVGWRRWLAVVAGFVGVAIMVGPTIGTARFAAAVFILGAALMWAATTLLTGLIGPDEAPATLLAEGALVFLVLSALGLPWVWQTPAPLSLAMMLGLGLIGGFGQLADIAAYRSWAASLLAPFEYTALIFAMLLDRAVWGVVPTPGMLVGAVVIAASGLYTLHREARRGAGRRSLSAQSRF